MTTTAARMARTALAALDPEQLAAVSLLYGYDRPEWPNEDATTEAGAARHLDISRRRLRRLHTEALDAMRAAIGVIIDEHGTPRWADDDSERQWSEPEPAPELHAGTWTTDTEAAPWLDAGERWAA